MTLWDWKMSYKKRMQLEGGKNVSRDVSRKKEDNKILFN